MKKKSILAALTVSALALVSTAYSTDDVAAGAQLYASNCSACHGANRAGIPGTLPALTDVGKRLDGPQIKDKIKKGGGLMPPFSQLSEQDIEDITAFLKQ